jgi:hypothetical protein
LREWIGHHRQNRPAPSPWFIPRAGLLAFGFLLLSAASHARQGPCSAQEGSLAEAGAGSLLDWDSLEKAYAQYNNCDEGAIGQAYSAAVARILVDHWETLPRLADIARGNPAFKAFVVKHVDQRLDAGDIKKIAENAKTLCPSGLGGLCHDLKKQAH